jgi:hypothetical protein
VVRVLAAERELMEGDTYIVIGLQRMHEEMHRRLLAATAESRKLRADMAHVEHVLKILRPDESMAPLSVKRRYAKNKFFKRGHLIREALRIMRQEARPVSADEIALKLLAEKGVTQPTRQQRSALRSGILTALGTHKGRNVIGNGARPQQWEPVKP